MAEIFFFRLEYLRNGESEPKNILQAIVPLGALQHFWPVGAEVYGLAPEKWNLLKPNLQKFHNIDFL